MQRGELALTIPAATAAIQIVVLALTFPQPFARHIQLLWLWKGRERRCFCKENWKGDRDEDMLSLGLEKPGLTDLSTKNGICTGSA